MYIVVTEEAVAGVSRQQAEGCGHLAREGDHGDHHHTVQGITAPAIIRYL